MACSFFYIGCPLRPSLFDHARGELFDQGFKLPIVSGVRGDGFDLVARNVAADRFAVLPALEVVVGPAGSLPNNTELARLHVLNVGDLLENLGRGRCFHDKSIFDCIYFVNKNMPFSCGRQNFVLHPHPHHRR